MIGNHPHQRAWDVALFEAWRANLQITDAVIAWHRSTSKRFEEVQPHLRRAPPLGHPWSVGVRAFVAQRLPLISNRLWSQPPGRDIALIDKLQTSGYTTHRAATTDADRQLRSAQRDARNASAKICLHSTLISERNRATDWNVTNSAKVRIRAAR